jgi:hypothetical protein
MTEPKKFLLSKEQIKPLATGLGGCIATDRIVIDGCKVGYMYREAPDNNLDSGWRFLAGDENDSYMDTPGNHGIYDVNTIANYDPEITSYVHAAIGSSFERRDGGPLQVITDP